MQGKRKTYSLLVGVKNGIATLEKGAEFPQKAKHRAVV